METSVRFNNPFKPGSDRLGYHAPSPEPSPRFAVRGRPGSHLNEHSDQLGQAPGLAPGEVSLHVLTPTITRYL